jgi:hypothetical protein
VEVTVTRQDGTPAPGAAVIVTHSSGRQTYAPADEEGVAVFDLPEGAYSLRIVQDGQHGEAAVEVGDAAVQVPVRLQDGRKLYIFMGTTGNYECDPSSLASFSILEDAIRAKYPDAVYLTGEDRYSAQFRDGDALMSVEIFLESYTSDEAYFASEMKVTFKTYQECITAWDMDEGGQEINIEFADGNICSVRVRNEYDYEYTDSACVVTESYYAVQRDRHLCKYADWADAWEYGYTMDTILSTSSESRVKAKGAGTAIEKFWNSLSATRFRDYQVYMEEIFPYVDLWMSREWNQGVDQLASAD